MSLPYRHGANACPRIAIHRRSLRAAASMAGATDKRMSLPDEQTDCTACWRLFASFAHAFARFAIQTRPRDPGGPCHPINIDLDGFCSRG